MAVLGSPEVDDSLFEKLAFITEETNTVGLVTVCVVDPTAAAINLLDLAVRGGNMSTW